MIKHKPIESGDVFSSWTVLQLGPMKYTSQTYVCKCKCGNIQTVIGTNLRNKKSTRCIDCYNKDIKAKNYKHGKAANYNGKMIEGMGTSKLFEDWVKYLNISEASLRKYLRKGLSIDTVAVGRKTEIAG